MAAYARGMVVIPQVLCLRSMLTLAVGVLLMAGAGCKTPQRVANRVITAPNLQSNMKPMAQGMMNWVEKGTKLTNVFTSRQVAVGPPTATLQTMELAPGDYHLKVEVTVELQPNGKHQLSMNVLPNPTFGLPVVPLQERGTVVVLHGYAMDKETMLPWAFVLAQAGYRVVLVDLRGHGGSTGSMVSFGKYEAEDLVQMLDERQRQGLGQGKVGVLGYSLGADLALHWAVRDARVGTVVALAPYNNLEDALQRLSTEFGMAISPKLAHATLGLVGAKLGVDWADWSGIAAARGLKVPVLLVGGAKDSISRPEDIEALKVAAPEGSKCIMVPIANHEALGVWLHELGEPVKEWFGNHLASER
jgi:pimeloyl-ACP methyl ester carboxylesterase